MDERAYYFYVIVIAQHFIITNLIFGRMESIKPYNLSLCEHLMKL